nr:hypothetical protein 1 [Red mite virga-like virus 2]
MIGFPFSNVGLPFAIRLALQGYSHPPGITQTYTDLHHLQSHTGLPFNLTKHTPNHTLVHLSQHNTYTGHLDEGCFALVKGFSISVDVCRRQIPPRCGSDIHRIELDHTWYGTRVEFCFALPTCACPPDTACKCGAVLSEPTYIVAGLDLLYRIAHPDPNQGPGGLIPAQLGRRQGNYSFDVIQPQELLPRLKWEIYNNLPLADDFALLRRSDRYSLVTRHCVNTTFDAESVSQLTHESVVDHSWTQLCLRMPAGFSHDCPSLWDLPLDGDLNNALLHHHPRKFALQDGFPFLLYGRPPTFVEYVYPITDNTNTTHFPVHFTRKGERLPAQTKIYCFKVHDRYLSDVTHGLWDFTRYVAHALELIAQRLVLLVSPILSEVFAFVLRALIALVQDAFGQGGAYLFFSATVSFLLNTQHSIPLALLPLVPSLFISSDLASIFLIYTILTIFIQRIHPSPLVAAIKALL